VNVSEAFVNHWLAWIRLFDFDVHYIISKKHLIVNDLLWWLWISENDKKNKNDIKDFINTELFCFEVHSYWVSAERAKKRIVIINMLNLKSDYIEKQKQFIKFLIFLKWFKNLNSRQFTQFKKNAFKFIV